jgi:O-antigen ligase
MKRWCLRDPFTMTALILISLAFLLHFKRGTWFSLFVALIWMGYLMRSRTPLLVFAGLAAASLGLPAVRRRLALLQEEFSSDLGGRYALWTEAAPTLLAEHPLGMGWRVMGYEELSALVSTLQPNLDHLHNNLFQIGVDAGWVGLAAWMTWMVVGLGVGARQAYRLRSANPQAASIAIGASGALVALLANGMVEFNFGDSEIFMTYLFLMGLSLFLRKVPPDQPWTSPPPSPRPTIL